MEKAFVSVMQKPENIRKMSIHKFVYVRIQNIYGT